MTKGADGKTIDGMSIERITALIQALKTEEYKPDPRRRVYIPKKNGKQRPLGIPSVEDKLVQEVVRMLLESIYESSFANTSKPAILRSGNFTIPTAERLKAESSAKSWQTSILTNSTSMLPSTVQWCNPVQRQRFPSPVSSPSILPGG